MRSGGRGRNARKSGRGARNGGRGGNGKGNRCFNCNGTGHFAYNCPKAGGRGNQNQGNRNFSKDPERRFFDKVTKDHNATITSAADATRLLKSALTFALVEGASGLLYRFVDPELNGAGALKKCLEYVTEKSVFVEGFLPLVDFLGRDELNKPVYSVPLKSILAQLYELPFLAPCIAEHCKNGHVTSNTERTALIWFFTMICLEHEKARGDAKIKEIASSLEGYGGAGNLKTVLEGSTAASALSLADVRTSQAALPGGRHDNDKQDFRSISIVPTLAEFLCEADPYLPVIPAEEMCQASEAQLLDRHFRLLREDIIGPSKEQQDDPRKERRDIVYGLRVSHVEKGAAVVQGENRKRIIGETNACISFKFQLPKSMHSYFKLKGGKEKEDYWENKNRRFLPRNALVCLQRRNEDFEWTPIRFATIARREAKELAAAIPVIGLQFLAELDTLDTLKELSHRSAPPTRLFVISGELFAYAPILRGLQMMSSIPFSDEIVRSSVRTSEAFEVDITGMESSIQKKIDMLDTAQNVALQSALKHRVALIQGPPGTGKTFIGVLLAQILLSATTSTILVVTYTNHALDDILEDLLDVGITEIVRMGGRSSSDRLTEYNLRELASSGKAPFTREQNRRYAQLKGTIEEAEKEVNRLQRILSREIGEKWWHRIGHYLKTSYPECWRQLYINDSDVHDEEGFRVHSIKGEDYLWKCWLKGKKLPDFLRSVADGELWNQSKQQRHEQKLEWQYELYAAERSAMATALATINTAKAELKQLKETTDSQILSGARVIGCTTTKAAMCKSLLDGLSPEIVLVEEAAEIHEAHVLTSLSAGTERLIMIGDHKQLRPKCQHYPLTVEANRDFNLNLSLFERLASSIPISTLEMQHRMHPDISAIPKLLTYEQLKDATSVKSHPIPKGLPSRVVFIDHNVEEDQEADVTGASEISSRTNVHEVEMVVGTVRFLFQQGYKPTDLVVLTPYLGQMLKIQNALAKDYNVFIDDRDLAEAREKLAHVELAGSQSMRNAMKSLVRVATIDNYQGEEAKIVVASLVRSNVRGEIGFLKEAERVNVMLSRARDFQIIIGSRTTFSNAKGTFEPLRGGPLWKKIFEYLEDSGFIYRGLPVTCQEHGIRSMVTTPSEFHQLCRHGGCNKMCSRTLECGHPCKKWCHVGACMPCQLLCLDKCPRGHSLMRKCSEDPPQCNHTITWRCPLNHLTAGRCSLGAHHGQCTTCSKLNKEMASRKARELDLHKEFDSKYEKLESLHQQVQEARLAKKHKDELARIDNELAIAQKALNDALIGKVSCDPEENLPGTEASDDSFLGTSRNVNTQMDDLQSLNMKVRTLLNFDGIDPNVLLRRYKDQYGSDLRVDAKNANSEMPSQSQRGGKKQKLKQLLTEIPCCDIVMAPSSSPNGKQTKMLVRLRDSEVANTSMSEEQPSPKRRRTKASTVASRSEMKSETLSEHTTAAAENHSADGVGGRVNDLTVGASCSREAIRSEGINLDVPSQDVESHSVGDSDAHLLRILQRYCSHGVISADDLLEQSFPTGSPSPSGVCSLRSIIRYELDPYGVSGMYTANERHQSELSRTLHSVATAFCLRKEYPLQARAHAEIALDYIHKLDINVPSAWVEQLTVISNEMTMSRSDYTLPTLVDSSQEEWEDIKKEDRGAPSILSDSVLPMIGLEEVKKKFISMYHRVKVAKDQGDFGATSYNVRFEGNPGTGKTTIARHYGDFLRQLGVLGKDSTFKDTSGAKLVHEGVKGLKDILEDIRKVGGGVVFVDEAYQLVNDRDGKKVLDFILPLAESLQTEYGNLVWIFAGYKKPMEKLFEHNDGLPSRFPLRFVFGDYSDAELQRIFEDLMTHQTTRLVTTKGHEPETKQIPGGSTQRYPSSGSTMTGRKGGTWTYSSNMGWTDQFENKTVDPSFVGSSSSELITSVGDRWVEKNDVWTNRQSGVSQSHYPGSPQPRKSAVREKRSNPFTCENTKHLRMAIRRLGRRRGENGFGNARAVRVLFEQVLDRQAKRIAEERKRGATPDIFNFVETDLLGPKVTKETLKKSPAWKKLESMEGLVPVKESVRQIFNLVLKNVEREKREQPLYGVALNRLFLGNPGTGKTTVAKLYAEILADLGLLSKGEVIMKCASDFVGEALGQSEKLTQNILQSAEGCVLVVDEAYSLYSGGSGKTGTNDPYKEAVINTIVEKVQAKPGADIAVIMLGYKEQMEDMMRNVNPGLSRRFQVENAFMFPDFDDASLCRIMMASARRREVELKVPVAKRAVRILAKARAKPNFGNAGTAENLLSKAITRMQDRENAVELIPEDFGYLGDGPDSNTLDSLFDDLIGCREIKETMAELRATVQFSVAKGMPANSGVSFNYLFLGNPGTGKTTVAERMGKMFHALGLLASEEVVVAKASDLVTGYTGQAGKQTRELLRQSRGGVLFIDEAYQLNPNRGGHYMTEAVDELVGALTDEEFKGKVLVILAGYDEDMEEMLQNTNPGMKSRFSERVHFRNFDVDATVELLKLELDKRNISLDLDGTSQNGIYRLAEKLVGSADFGNGRDVVSWANCVYKVVAKRSTTENQTRADARDASSLVDVEEALQKLLQSRTVRRGGQKCAAISRPGGDMEEIQDRKQAPPPPHQTCVVTKVDVAVDEEQCDEPTAAINEIPENLFEGIDGMFLKKLQDFIDEEGLGSEEGTHRFAELDPTSAEFANLVARLQSELNMAHADATAQLLEWQSKHKDLEEMLQKQAQKAKTMGVRPIWRCGVCGRADKPWIACYVAPFIVGYEEVPVGESA